jgi:GR25 family glycosyltransferase involved in LPS biosynthesis
MNSGDIDFIKLPIYIIHVKGNSERYNLISSQLSLLGSSCVEIVNAVTPENISKYPSLEKYRAFFDLPNMQRWKVCCGLSHRLVHQMAQTQDYFLVLEDDFKILDDFDAWKQKLIKKNFNFDIIPMGGYYACNDFWYTKTGDPEIGVVKQITCSVATLYTRKGSDQFIHAFDNHFSPDNNAIDGLQAEVVFSEVITKSLFPLPISTHATVSCIHHVYLDHELYYKKYFETHDV